MDSRDVFCASAPRAFISFRYWSMRRNNPSPVATLSVTFEVSDTARRNCILTLTPPTGLSIDGQFATAYSSPASVNKPTSRTVNPPIPVGRTIFAINCADCSGDTTSSAISPRYVSLINRICAGSGLTCLPLLSPTTKLVNTIRLPLARASAGPRPRQRRSDHRWRRRRHVA
jgi:hypothetical protein